MRRAIFLFVVVSATFAQPPGPDPGLTLWQSVKSGLLDRHGDEYWKTVKDADLPGGAGGANAFRATVISSRPAAHPTEVVVAISDDHTPEATLKLSQGFEKALPKGTRIEFSGAAEAWVREPFMMTFKVDLRHGVDPRPRILPAR